MTDSDERLQRLLGGAKLAGLRQRLRRHFERGGTAEQLQFLQLSNLEPAERDALANLLGRRASSARSMRIDITAIDVRLLAAGIAESLRAALAQLDGPIVDRTAIRAAAARAWSEVLQQPGRDPRLAAWLQAPAASALLKRLARRDAAQAGTLIAQADAVLQRLPAPGLPRAQLAAETLGNAHALDDGRSAASIVLAAWRYAEFTPANADGASTHADPGDADPATTSGEPAERTRDTWARAGVLVNELARPALVLNLPIRGGALFPPGEPGYLSLRRLVRSPPAWAVRGQGVYVCENPNVVAIAADALGARCAPLACTNGMPAAAQRTLLDQLAAAGAELRYHGDFDWPGLTITNHVLRTWRARIWNMGTRDYETAVQNAPQRPRDLAPSTVAATWDPELAPAMSRCGLAVAEEAVADQLLADLERG